MAYGATAGGAFRKTWASAEEEGSASARAERVSIWLGAAIENKPGRAFWAASPCTSSPAVPAMTMTTKARPSFCREIIDRKAPSCPNAILRPILCSLMRQSGPSLGPKKEILWQGVIFVTDRRGRPG